MWPEGEGGGSKYGAEERDGGRDEGRTCEERGMRRA